MNSESFSTQGVPEIIQPLEILKRLADTQTSGCLQSSYNSIACFIYLKQGKLVYASNSIDPFERLGRHLRGLSARIPTLTAEVQNQARLNFETETEELNQNAAYQAIWWLFQENKLQSSEVTTLIERITQEVLESYLLCPEITFEKLYSIPEDFRVFCQLNTWEFIKRCQQRNQGWQALSPTIKSSYQRPYFLINSYAQKRIPPEQQKQLGNLLKGFNIRQLSALTNQDELSIAQKLYPLIVNGAVILRDPQEPFNKLPEIPANNLISKNDISAYNNGSDSVSSLEDINSTDERKFKIVCIDDSQTMLQEINRYLDDQNLSVFAIDDATRALTTILKVKPDLVLLDVGMPKIDGYQVCSMLRKHPLFKNIPIIMVTGNKGLIDRARAKIVGATDYMTKPFTQTDLLKMVFRYLI